MQTWLPVCHYQTALSRLQDYKGSTLRSGLGGVKIQFYCSFDKKTNFLEIWGAGGGGGFMRTPVPSIAWFGNSHWGWCNMMKSIMISLKVDQLQGSSTTRRRCWARRLLWTFGEIRLVVGGAIRGETPFEKIVLAWPGFRPGTRWLVQHNNNMANREEAYSVRDVRTRKQKARKYCATCQLKNSILHHWVKRAKSWHDNTCYDYCNTKIACTIFVLNFAEKSVEFIQFCSSFFQFQFSVFFSVRPQYKLKLVPSPEPVQI
jgi:hypothetical protein